MYSSPQTDDPFTLPTSMASTYPQVDSAYALGLSWNDEETVPEVPSVPSLSAQEHRDILASILFGTL